MTSSPAPPINALTQLAIAKFGPLSPAETLLTDYTWAGKKAVCGPNDDDDDPDNDPRQANNWGAARQVRADLLAWLCTDEDARKHVRWHGIELYGADIADRIDLSSVLMTFPLALTRCRLSKGCDLSRASVSSLDLSGSLVDGIAADGIMVASDVFLGASFIGVGTVRLLGAHVGGDLDCSDGSFTNPPVQGVKTSGQALHADGVDVKGSVFLSDSFQAQGEVRLIGARIAGDLECSAATFTSPPVANIPESGRALSADGINVKGSVYLRDKLVAGNNVYRSFSAKGEVNFHGASIDGDLDCRAAILNNPQPPAGENANALGAKRLVVKGAVFLNRDFRANGSVSLASAQISGPLNFLQGKFGLARLDLTDASAGTLIDSGCEWPRQGNLYLDGFTYRRISNDEPIDVDQRMNWLGLQPTTSFHPRPYLQLSKVLRESGDEAGALHVLEKMEDRRSAAEHGVLAWISRVWSWILKITIGYGYYPQRAFWSLLALCLAGWLLYCCGYTARNMVPTEKAAYDEFKMWGLVPSHYPHFSAFVFSLENSLPLVKLGQADKWQPEPARHDPVQARACPWCGFAGSPPFLTWFLRGQILLGWVLATLFVAGVSGVVRKE